MENAQIRDEPENKYSKHKPWSIRNVRSAQKVCAPVETRRPADLPEQCGTICGTACFNRGASILCTSYISNTPRLMFQVLLFGFVADWPIFHLRAPVCHTELGELCVTLGGGTGVALSCTFSISDETSLVYHTCCWTSVAEWSLDYFWTPTVIFF